MTGHATFGRAAAMAIATTGALSPIASGQLTVPFTETFEDGVSGWTDASGFALSPEPGGGPDGSAFASGSFNFVDFSPGGPSGGTAIMLRAEDSNDASGDAFVGDWLDGGVSEFSAFVRHDAPEPLSYFARFATSSNFPGGIITSTAPVQPNAWTELSFDIDPDNPLFVPEGPGADFETVFASVGNVQIGVDGSPLAGLDQEIAFDVDGASIVPAPAGAAALLGGLGFAGRRRR